MLWRIMAANWRNKKLTAKSLTIFILPLFGYSIKKNKLSSILVNIGNIFKCFDNFSK